MVVLYFRHSRFERVLFAEEGWTCVVQVYFCLATRSPEVPSPIALVVLDVSLHLVDHSGRELVWKAGDAWGTKGPLAVLLFQRNGVVEEKGERQEGQRRQKTLLVLLCLGK